MTIRLKPVLAFVLTLALCPFTLLAQVPAAPLNPAAKPAMPPEARETTRAALLARTGGFIAMPAAGPSILFLNTQKLTAETEIRAVADTLSTALRLPVTVATRETADPLAEATKALADTNVAAVVVVADLPGQPSLLIAPENRWALVNSAALGGKDVSSELRDERVRKELWRAFGYLMGAGHSNTEKCLMRSVLSPADLDALTMKSFSLEPFGKIMTHAKSLGMAQRRTTFYRKAVEEGWAPAPTNDTQKAIWNEVKNNPKKTE